MTSDIHEVHEHGRAVGHMGRLPEKAMDGNHARFSFRVLTQRRDKLLDELRVLAPELVEKLELTLEELQRHEHNGLDHSA